MDPMGNTKRVPETEIPFDKTTVAPSCKSEPRTELPGFPPPKRMTPVYTTELTELTQIQEVPPSQNQTVEPL